MIWSLLLAAMVQSLSPTVIPPPAAVPPPPAIPVVVWVRADGSTEIVRVALLNPLKDLPRPAERTLNAKLHVAHRVIDVELHRIGPEVEVPSDGYLSESYAFDVPAGLSGEAILSFDSIGDDGYHFTLGQK